MSWMTILWSMNAAACLTLAGFYFVAWCKQRENWVHLLFSSSAVATAAIAVFELAMMHAVTVGRYQALVRWIHVPVWVLIVSLVIFVRLYLHAGRRWLAWSICSLRTLVLILNFIFTSSINYRQITGLRQFPWGGEIISVPIGVANPWGLLSSVSLLLLLIFFVDAAITVWRRGDRRRALVVVGSMILGAILAWHVPLVIWGIIDIPFFLCFAYSGIVVAMGYELSNDIARAAQLAPKLKASQAALRKSEQDMEVAALEAARQRQELTHLARVTSLGELSSSLAHELTHPLTAILSNAQAAQRFLADDDVDLNELREILNDIVAQDQRAGEVIHRLRSLLKKGEPQRHCDDVDVNEVARDVLKLMRNDLINKNVTVDTDLAQNLPAIRADRVQLQQVVLNLLLNACEAMTASDASERQLLITSKLDNGAVRMSVTDRGGGIPEEKLEQVFERFFTTKKECLLPPAPQCLSSTMTQRYEKLSRVCCVRPALPWPFLRPPGNFLPSTIQTCRDVSCLISRCPTSMAFSFKQHSVLKAVRCRLFFSPVTATFRRVCRR
jgi:signal transduction histidine kinase